MGRAFVATLVLAMAGCSAIPGDGALRRGQFEQAAQLYQRGAVQGNAEAALRLGMLIDNREVSAAAYGSAGFWLKKACEMGSVAGCHHVGVAYEYGRGGLPKDYAQARVYYLRAATTGYMLSQYNLGGMYANNHVSPPNNVEGLKWLLLAQRTAAKDKDQPSCQWVLRDAPGHRRRLEARLTLAQQAEAHRLAAAWKVNR